MKKLMVLLLAGTYAATYSNDTESPRVVTFNVTLCKQTGTNDQAWDKVVRKAQKLQKKNSTRQLKKFSKTINVICESEPMVADIQVQMSDGVCRCSNKDSCKCMHEYKGVCPCATLITKSCAGKSSCCAK